MDINEVIDLLSERLGVAANELFFIMEKQAKIALVKDIFSILFLLFGLIICILILFLVFKKKRENGKSLFTNAADKEGWDTFDRCMFTLLISLIPCIAGAIFVGMLVDTSTDFIICILNPKYWALQEIFSLISG